MVSDGAIWAARQEDDVKLLEKHAENYPLEKTAFFIYQITWDFDFDDRINPTCLKGLTPIIDYSKKPGQVDVSFCTTPYLCVIDGMLVKNSEKFKEIAEVASDPVIEAFCSTVEAAISAKVPISQGVHDRYVAYYASKGKDVQQIRSPEPQGCSSQLIRNASGSLAFNQDYFATLGVADISGISPEEAGTFFKIYETAIEHSTAITQGLHDRYAKLCVSTSRKPQDVTGLQLSKFQVQLEAHKAESKNNSTSSSKGSSSSDSKLRDEAMAGLTDLAWTGSKKPLQDKKPLQGNTPLQKQNQKQKGKKQETKPTKTPDFSNTDENALFEKLSWQADEQAAKIAKLTVMLEKELAKQMQDNAEAQRLEIDNIGLKAENAKMRALLKA